MTWGVVRDHTPPAVRNSGNRRPCRLGWTYGERFAGGTCSARTPHGAAQRLRRALGSAVSFDQQSGPAIPAVWYGTTLHALSGPHRSGDTAGLAECGSGATRKKRKARGTTPEPWQAAAFTAPESAGPGQQERWSAARDTRPVRVDGPPSGHNQEAMPDLHRTGRMAQLGWIPASGRLRHFRAKGREVFRPFNASEAGRRSTWTGPEPDLAEMRLPRVRHGETSHLRPAFQEQPAALFARKAGAFAALRA